MLFVLMKSQITPEFRSPSSCYRNYRTYLTVKDLVLSTIIRNLALQKIPPRDLPRLMNRVYMTMTRARDVGILWVHACTL